MNQKTFLGIFSALNFLILFFAAFDSWSMYRMVFWDTAREYSLSEHARWWGGLVAVWLAGWVFFSKMALRYELKNMLGLSLIIAAIANWAVWRQSIQRIEYDYNGALILGLVFNFAMCYLVHTQQSVLSKMVAANEARAYKQGIAFIVTIAVFAYTFAWKHTPLNYCYAIATLLYITMWFIIKIAFIYEGEQDLEIPTEVDRPDGFVLGKKNKPGFWESISAIARRESFALSSLLIVGTYATMTWAAMSGAVLSLKPLLDTASLGMMFLVLFFLNKFNVRYFILVPFLIWIWMVVRAVFFMHGA